jgi:hypothetical protein
MRRDGSVRSPPKPASIPAHVQALARRRIAGSLCDVKNSPVRSRARDPDACTDAYQEARLPAALCANKDGELAEPHRLQVLHAAADAFDERNEDALCGAREAFRRPADVCAVLTQSE